MRAGEKPKTATVYFQGLIDGEFHGEIGDGLTVFIIELVRKDLVEVYHVVDLGSIAQT
jgi:hypothetical protein